MQPARIADQLDAEWLEADGLGGFASGTVGGIRTRRYHALLCAATTPPTGRMVLVNGLETWLETDAGRFPLTAQRYGPEVIHPDGHTRIVAFRAEPWPSWTLRAEDGTEISQEVVAHHERPEVVVRWRLLNGAPAQLVARPLISGRDYHALHHENDGFSFAAERAGARVRWQPYSGVPAVAALANGSYRHEPLWYRNFEYEAERERGLDFVEDLASPGAFTWTLNGRDAVLVLRAETVAEARILEDAPELYAARIVEAEGRRRGGFTSPLQRAADQYVVRRGGGRTIVAGYPWFTDWGRDTLIALRGLMGLPGGHELARDILTAWAPTVSEGMVPNRFADAAEAPEYNAVDASLWYVVAVHEFLAQTDAARMVVPSSVERPLHEAVDQILKGFSRGTRYGIRLDHDGLIAAGVPGVQLTWMDAKVGDWVVTPRIGKPVEVQALWLNALRIASTWQPEFSQLHDRALAAFRERFWNPATGSLHDVVDVDHVAGRNDGSVRPNQILAVGGLPFRLLEDGQSRQVVEVVETKLLTPLGLRSLAPDEPGYQPRYGGDPLARDGAYHQGTVWPWLMGPFVEAWLRVHGARPEAAREAEERFLAPLRAHLAVAGIGHVSEIADGEPPHTPRGCPFQAWSLAELLRAENRIETCGALHRARRASKRSGRAAG